MEVTVTEQGITIFQDKMDMLMGLIALGFSIALVVIVISAAVKAGWKLWPWVLGIGAIVYFLF